MASPLDRDLADAVLGKLGVHRGEATPDAHGLAVLYAAWCRGVPFDNIVKRIHLESGDPAPVPNQDPTYFFQSWLEHGTGGTCWPSTLALHALLVTLDFDVRIGSAAMRDDLAPDVHSHGTLLVTTRDGTRNGDDQLWWVDTSMLTESPIPLQQGAPTELAHPLRPARAEPVGERWRVHWYSPALGGEMPCLLLDDNVTTEHCRARYEWSRENGPFNQAVFATLCRPDAVHSFGFGALITLDRDGTTRVACPPDERNRVLQTTFGYSTSILDGLPADVVADVLPEHAG